MTTSTMSPVRVDARLEPVSRWLWLFKWLLALPHLVVLAALWVAFAVVTAAAFVAILVTGRYPRPLFDFNAGVLRWTWRVAYYSYGGLGTDRYPPFTLGEAPDYPATLTIDYPGHLSRGLVLVKWWLLAIPHYIVVGLFLGGGTWVAFRSTGDNPAGSGPGLIGILVLVAGVTLAVTGRYPRGVFDLVLGLNRWVLRVAAYAGLMTDSYPPFRLDLGPATGAAAMRVPDAPPPSRRGRPPDAGRIIMIVIGSLLALPSLGLLAAGTAVLVVDQTARDADGFLASDPVRVSTATAALVSSPADFHIGVDAMPLVDSLLGDVRLRVTGTDGSPVFVGIARASDVDRWLARTAHDRVTGFSDDTDRLSYERAAGALSPLPAQEAMAWVATDQGQGLRTVEWPVRSGRWTAVVSRADGRPGVRAEVAAAATVPALPWLGAGMLGGAVLLGALAAVLLAVALRTPREEAGDRLERPA